MLHLHMQPYGVYVILLYILVLTLVATVGLGAWVAYSFKEQKFDYQWYD